MTENVIVVDAETFEEETLRFYQTKKFRTVVVLTAIAVGGAAVIALGRRNADWALFEDVKEIDIINGETDPIL
jgi:hypothetical protein